MKPEPQSRPIGFKTYLIQRIIAGEKTVTRRTKGLEFMNDIPFTHGLDRMPYKKDGRWFYDLQTDVDDSQTFELRCPYGQPGDLLWIRETFCQLNRDVPHEYFYLADALQQEDYYPPDWKWSPSIFMPRKAARILLEIEDVRPERLMDGLTNDEAVLEGVERQGDGWRCYKTIKTGRHKGEEHPFNAVPMREAVFSFEELWDEINGEHNFSTNPWVWRIQFKVVAHVSK